MTDSKKHIFKRSKYIEAGIEYLWRVSLQYDFPKQEAVIQFVIDAIQAEAFNPRTLFLIGSYTIGRVQFISFWIFMIHT